MTISNMSQSGPSQTDTANRRIVLAKQSQAPICNIDFYSDASIANPAATYKAMLALGPVVWLEKNKLHAICGHAEVVASLRDHASFASGKGVSINEDINKLLIGSTLNSDPPAHDITRKITFAPVSPKNLREISALIESEARSLADTMVAAGEFDAASELAPYLPLTVVRNLVGLGDYGKDNMLEWGAATFELMGDAKERREAALTHLKQLRIFLEDPDTLHNLSESGWARGAMELGLQSGMQAGRAAELMRDYIAPSLDTTISAIGFGIKLFAENPDQWSKLCKNRALMKNAIEEIVRLNTPIRAFTRYVVDTTEVAGITLEKATRVLIVYGAANRDATRFENPDQFDIERKTIGHVGFGQGVHACLGMNLARLEMMSLFAALADRVKRFEFTGEVVPGVNSTIYSLAHVPVKVIV